MRIINLLKLIPKKKEEQNEHKKKNKEKIQKMRVLKNQNMKMADF